MKDKLGQLLFRLSDKAYRIGDWLEEKAEAIGSVRKDDNILPDTQAWWDRFEDLENESR